MGGTLAWLSPLEIVHLLRYAACSDAPAVVSSDTSCLGQSSDSNRAVKTQSHSASSAPPTGLLRPCRGVPSPAVCLRLSALKKITYHVAENNYMFALRTHMEQPALPRVTQLTCTRFLATRRPRPTEPSLLAGPPTAPKANMALLLL